MANSSRLCLICGGVFDSDAVRRAHIETDHPGQRIAWHGRVPYIVGPDGSETKIGPAAIKRMRRGAVMVTGGESARRPRRTVARRPAVPAAAPDPVVMVETPLPDDPDAPPYFVQAQPFHLTAAGQSIPPAGVSDPAGGAPPDVSPLSPASIASRETIRLALDQATLAGMIRNLSIVVSEWDGAGERGHLSQIESAQLAMLLHEPAITAVQRYFGGNVDRFRLALALGILLLGKGRIHLVAIRTRMEERQAAQYTEPAEAASYAATQPAMPIEVPTEPAPYDPLAELAAKQRAWNTTPREATA